MKYNHPQLIDMLRIQREAVLLIDENGHPHPNLSPRHVANLITDGNYWGYGKNGVVERVRPAGLDLEPFLTRPAVRQVMNAFPRLPVVHSNPQAPGGMKWVRQIHNTRTGSTGAQRTLHFRP